MKFLQKNKMKLIGSALAFLALPFAALAGYVKVTALTVQQRYPWDGLVDITVTIQGSAEDVTEYDCVFVATNSATKAAIPVEHITRNGSDTGSGNVWTRKFIWDAKADVGAVKIDEVALTVDVVLLPYVQLWENGPYWAKCNVGATKPEEYGYYFWWGDTVGYKRNAADNGWVSVASGTSFSFSEGNCRTYNSTLQSLRSLGYIDSTGNLVAAHDAATAHLGAPWRMPTDAEFEALISNCTTTWERQNGVGGRRVTGKGNFASKSIFLPAAGLGTDSMLISAGGLYWSSTPDSGDSNGAWRPYFGTSWFDWGCNGRYRGQSIRPVRGFSSTLGQPIGGAVAGAVEASAWPFTNDSSAPWSVDTAEKAVGASSVKSGVIGDNGVTTLSTTVTGAGTIGFRWKIDSEYNYDYLHLIVDGSEAFNNKGVNNVWQTKSYAISGSGTHTIEWRYTKDGIRSRGSDCGWIDGITWNGVHPLVTVVTTHFALDCRDGTRTVSTSGENLRYDASWYANGSQAHITDNGASVVSGVTGTKHWKPTDCGNHHLQLTVVNGTGAQVGSASADFTFDSGEHVRTTTISAIAPTCTAAGRTAEVKCTRCGVTLEASHALAALGHDRKTTITAIEPTCMAAGRTAEVVCARCGVTLETSHALAALGHAPKTTIEALAPTCTTDGHTVEVKCDRCGVTLEASQSIPSHGGHIETISKPAVAPTSGKPGSTEEIKCSRCGEVLQASTTIPALGYIRNVTAAQLWPHKKVSVCYELADDIGEVVSADTPLVLTCGYNMAKTILGDTRFVPGLHRVVWDMEADGVVMQEGNVRFRVANHKPDAPGFLRKAFHTSSLVFDTTSDLWNGGTTIVNRPDELYVKGLAEHTTVAYGCYMQMTGGVTYNFKGCYDDFAAVKINGAWVVGKGNECKEVSGSFTPTSTGLYQVEFRVGNNGGDGGCVNSSQYGIMWNSSKDSTWRLVENGASGNLFFVDQNSYNGIGIHGESGGVKIDTSASVKDGMTVSKTTTLGFSPIDASEVEVQIDGWKLLSSEESGEYTWMPVALGTHTLKHIAGDKTWTRKVNVTELAFATDPTPKPPTAADSKITIIPTTRSVAIGGGTSAITTSGSGTWAASASDSWITLNATSGAVGTPVGYRVAANDGIGQRVGYVYVSGRVHTVTQEGHEAEVTPTKIAVELQGGSGTIEVAPGGHYTWTARPNNNWLSISATSGTDAGTITYTVAPYNEVATRSGSLTVAGKTVKITQTGRRMKLAAYANSCDYQSHVIPIVVEALSSTTWSTEVHAPWLSIVDSDNGQNRKGGGNLSVAAAENPSYLPRTGTVTVGTETFTITQSGRPTAALSFSVSPTASSASVNGANGLVAVTATPDLPWSAASGANWLTVAAALSSGAGNGNVVYSVSPNPTMSTRTGKITVTPEAKSGLAAKTHTVTQPAATSMVSEDNHDFDAKGDSFEVDVAIGDIVNWSITCNASWVTIDGGLSRIGPGKVKIATAANPTVEDREATITIAGHAFKIFQPGRAVEVDSGSMVFGTASEALSIDVHPDGNARWTAYVSDPTWILLWGDGGCSVDADGNVTGTGDAVLDCIVTDYVGDGTPRTGSITIGDQVIYITQRAYEMSISPSSTEVSPNAGAGEIGVPAPVGAIWDAIATEPWIKIISGYDSGTGSGTVRYSLTENDTGRTRTGKILISGEEYTITQAARQMVKVQVGIEGGGSVSGNGTYELGTSVTLKATAKSGHEFTGWRMANGSIDKTNPLKLTADVDKAIVATFRQIPIYIVNGETVREGESRTFTAPAAQVDAKGTTKLICKGASAFPKMGTSFTLKITQDVTVDWDIWETNYMLTVESPTGGKIMEGSAVAQSRWFKAGETVSLTAVPNSGYAFFRWTDGGREAIALPAGTEWSFVMDGPRTVGAIFGVFNDTLAGALDAPGMTFVTGGDAVWCPVVDASASTGISSARSGAIGADKETWLETTVEGPGELSFNWRVDCEKSVRNDASWDRLSVFTNGVEAARIDGRTDWRLVTLPINGRTTVRWSFYRDDFDEAPPGTQNCGWVDSVIWTGKEGK